MSRNAEGRREPKTLAKPERLEGRADGVGCRVKIAMKCEPDDGLKIVGLSDVTIEERVKRGRHRLVSGKIDKELSIELSAVVVCGPRLNAAVGMCAEIFAVRRDRLDMGVETAGLKQNPVGDRVVAVNEAQPDHDSAQIANLTIEIRK